MRDKYGKSYCPFKIGDLVLWKGYKKEGFYIILELHWHSLKFWRVLVLSQRTGDRHHTTIKTLVKAGEKQ